MSAKVCYIGHSYHKKTGSTNFFFDFLEEIYGSIDRFDDETYLGNVFDSYDEIRQLNYQLIVVFQSEHIAKTLAETAVDTKIIFVPMYDGCRSLGLDYWNSFKDKDNVLVISFSSTLHTQLRFWGIKSVRFQYFPKVPESIQQRKDKRTGFFWARTNCPSLDIINSLIGDAELDNMHIHMATDPGHELSLDQVNSVFKDKQFTVSDWFDTPEQYKDLIKETSIYFAPREYEGIGMSFLEAMAMGCCVVAPNNPTMNEYIDNGVNGILYDLSDPKKIDLTNIASMSRQARKLVSNGRAVWEQDRDGRLRYLIEDFVSSNVIDDQEFSFWHWNNIIQDTPPIDQLRSVGNLTDSSSKPTVTVAVVCRNAEDVIEKTLLSVLLQTYENFECVVVDGQSTDSTRQVVSQYLPLISRYVSEPDNGPYDAMSKAAAIGRGEYIIYINAGDYFHDRSSLKTSMDNVFDDTDREHDDPDFIVGNHVYLHAAGASALHRANRFDDTWNALKAGNMVPSWWSGIPCHQSTFTRRRLIAEEGYNPDFKIAADHEFMFRQRSQGRTFVHCNSTVSAYIGGGLSSIEVDKCGEESWRIASTYGNRELIKQYFITVFGTNSVYTIPEHVKQEVIDIRESSVFWEDWYRLNYLPDHLKDLDPIVHYLLEGRMIGAMPNPCFDPEHYYEKNTDVPRSQFDPLVHYVRNGQHENRTTLDWDSPESIGAFLSSVFNPYERSLADIDDELAKLNPETLVSCINAQTS